MLTIAAAAAVVLLVGLLVARRRRPPRPRRITLGSVTAAHRARLDTDDAQRPQ